MTAPSLFLGDVVLVWSPGWIGRLIRWFTRSRGEAPTRCNHVALISKAGTIETAQATEALWTVTEHDLSQVAGGVIEIRRKLDLTNEQRRSIALRARARIGQRYAWPLILLHLVDGAIGKLTGGNPRIARSLIRWGIRPICSLLVGDSYEGAIGYRFGGVDGLRVTPDTIADDVSGRGWVKVATRTKGVWS